MRGGVPRTCITWAQPLQMNKNKEICNISRKLKMEDIEFWGVNEISYLKLKNIWKCHKTDGYQQGTHDVTIGEPKGLK